MSLKVVESKDPVREGGGGGGGGGGSEVALDLSIIILCGRSRTRLENTGEICNLAKIWMW